jgi:hypothetical protein
MFSSQAHLQEMKLQTYTHLQIYLYSIVFVPLRHISRTGILEYFHTTTYISIVFITLEHISETLVSEHVLHTSRDVYTELYSFLWTYVHVQRYQNSMFQRYVYLRRHIYSIVFVPPENITRGVVLDICTQTPSETSLFIFSPLDICTSL